MAGRERRGDRREELKSTPVAHVIVSQKCTCALYMPRYMPVNTYIHLTLQHAASVGGVLDDATDGRQAAAAGCAPAAKSLVARAVQVVELPQPARGPRVRTERSAATNHGLATADR